jgi:biopolymer transport protein ExbD
VNWKTPILILIACWGIANAQPAMRHLYFLLHDRVRFDDGPVLDLHQLQVEIRKTKRQTPYPSLQPSRQASYSLVARVLKVFQTEGYDHLGFVGIEK